MIVAEWQTRHWFDTHSWQRVTGACSLQLLSIFKTQHCSKTSDVCRQSKIQRKLQAQRNITFAHFHSENMKKHKSIHAKSKVKAVSLTSIYVMTALRLLDAPTTHSMRSRVYVTVGRPSVRPSVCPSYRSTAAAAAGEFAAERGRRLQQISTDSLYVCSRRSAANAPSVTFRVE